MASPLIRAFSLTFCPTAPPRELITMRGDRETHGVDEHRQKPLDGRLVEGDVGQDDKEHRRSTPDSDRPEREPEKERAKNGVRGGSPEEVEDPPYGGFIGVEELQPHKDHQHPADSPCNGLVEEEEILSEVSCKNPEREEDEDRPERERHSQPEDPGERKIRLSTRKVTDQPEAQDTVARADAGDEAPAMRPKTKTPRKEGSNDVIGIS